MKYAFEILVNVNFYHTYFSNEIFGGLIVEPSSDTSRVMLNNGLLFKPFNGGFRIVFDTNFNNTTRTRAEVLKEELSLNFTARLNDGGFYNYTEPVEGDINRSIYYFKNNSTLKSKLKYLLSAHDFVGEKDLYPLTDFEENYFVKPFAKIDLQLHGDMETDYSIKFRAKETYWRYILVSDYLQELNSPAILESGSREAFDGPEKLALRGKDTLAFRSKNPISFSQERGKIFQLVDNYDPESGRYKVVMRALPLADPAHINVIEPASTNKSLNYSEIFIH